MSFLSTKLNLLNIGRSLLFRNGIDAMCLHTTASLDRKWNPKNTGPQKFLRYNDTIFPPQTPDEVPRPAVSVSCSHSICFARQLIIIVVVDYSMCAIKCWTSNTAHTRCTLWRQWCAEWQWTKPCANWRCVPKRVLHSRMMPFWRPRN